MTVAILSRNIKRLPRSLRDLAMTMRWSNVIVFDYLFAKYSIELSYPPQVEANVFIDSALIWRCNEFRCREKSDLVAV